MAAARVYFIFSVVSSLLAICAVNGSGHHNVAAPAPAVDCSSLVMDMAGCLNYVSNDSKVDKPEKECCDGLKTVLDTDADCVCAAFKTSSQLGVTLNITRSLALPAACNIKTHSNNTCGFSLPPAAGAPASASPTSSPQASSPTSSQQAVAPPPASSSSLLRTSIGSLFLVFIAAALSSF